MVPQSFVFPDKKYPKVLLTFDNCRLGENNTGLFYNDTDFAFKNCGSQKITSAECSWNSTIC